MLQYISLVLAVQRVSLDEGTPTHHDYLHNVHDNDANSTAKHVNRHDDHHNRSDHRES